MRAMAFLRPVAGAQDTPDFRTIYDAHVDFVWRNLRRLGVLHEDAEDKTQEVFVVAYRKLSEFQDRGHGFRAWLFQIVLRVASDARRYRRRHPEDPAHDREPPASSPRVSPLARRLLDEALARVHESRRAVLLLHDVEEFTAKEIADTLEIPTNTVYSRLRVARAEFEAAYRELGGDDA